ncbi:hypothetical protein JHW43_002519 [Diplocarpon mali]|nr:hypothetical protein JHW43_002519 [Diplocarpon mali]
MNAPIGSKARNSVFTFLSCLFPHGRRGGDQESNIVSSRQVQPAQLGSSNCSYTASYLDTTLEGSSEVPLTSETYCADSSVANAPIQMPPGQLQNNPDVVFGRAVKRASTRVNTPLPPPSKIPKRPRQGLYLLTPPSRHFASLAPDIAGLRSWRRQVENTPIQPPRLWAWDRLQERSIADSYVYGASSSNSRGRYGGAVVGGVDCVT